MFCQPFSGIPVPWWTLDALHGQVHSISEVGMCDANYFHFVVIATICVFTFYYTLLYFALLGFYFLPYSSILPMRIRCVRFIECRGILQRV